MTSVAPRIFNDVSYVTGIKHASHFASQAQYLARLEDDICCSAHFQRRFICDGDRKQFFVGGAVFGEVGG